MNVLRKPMRPLMLCLVISLATACATTPDASYSVTKDAINSAVRIEHKTMCSITKPTELSAGAFDASPLEARQKMVKDVEKWAAECAGSV